MRVNMRLPAVACGLLLLLLPLSGAPRPPVRRYDLSGHIANNDGHRMTVRLTGHNRPSRSTLCNPDGHYRFQNVLAGVYEVRPVRQYYTFSPSFHTVNLSSHDVHGVNFTAHEHRPRRR